MDGDIEKLGYSLTKCHPYDTVTIFDTLKDCCCIIKVNTETSKVTTLNWMGGNTG